MHSTATFGQWLKQRRKELDLTQEELATRMGCSEIAIRKLEAGSRRPSKQMAELLADLFKVPQAQREAFVNFARGLDEVTAPPESVSGHETHGNLPALLTHLIGREETVSEVASYLLQDGIRLLTLTGTPGTGKTSLATHVAADLTPHFRDGAYFVALAPVVDAAMVVAGVAKVFGLTDKGHRLPGEALSEFLRDKQMLLLLDNFEQVIEAAPVVVDLLERCPSIKVMTTSREPLHVRGERVFRVPPLQVPNLSPEALKGDTSPARMVERMAQSPAVALFVERAHATEPEFALTEENAQAVGAICVRLQGLPLAIELAAARVRLFTPREIQARLDSAWFGHLTGYRTREQVPDTAGAAPPTEAGYHARMAPGAALKLLSGGPRDLPARQQTLHRAIDWSYALLNEGEQTLFARLGVFMGSFGLPAAEAICNALGDLPFDVVDGIESLIDKSLLRRAIRFKEEKAGGGSRYVMLEMIREYALERLERGGRSEHGENADNASARSLSGEPLDHPAPRAESIRRLHAEYFLALAQEAETHLRGAQQVEWLDRLEEEHDNLRGALRWALQQNEIELALRLAGTLWKFWELHGYLSEGRTWLAAALALSGSEKRSTMARPRIAALGKALFAAGRLAERQGDNAASLPLLEESLVIARKIDDKPLIALVLHNLSNLATYRGAYVEGRTLAEESLAIRTQMGDRWGMANTLHNLGFQAEAMGDNPAAYAYFEQSLAISRELEDKWGIAYSLDGVGILTMERGDYATACSLLREGLDLRRQLGDKSGIARSLERLARVAGKEGQPLRAARLFGAVEALRNQANIPIMPVDLIAYQQAVARARAQMSEAAWSEAWKEGRTMVTDEVIDYALGSGPNKRPGD